jgi:D-serine deaminase-like pyridoxal phosphate-dependent protein
MSNSELDVKSKPFIVPDDIETPVLVVDEDVLLSNLREMSDLCHASGVELLPHAKTHRTVELGRLQMDNGADGLTVATVEEADAFISGGITRVLIAYPLVGSHKVRRALQLAQEADLTLAADSLEGARAIGQIFAECGQKVDLLLIVDTGMGRCGINPNDAAPFALAMSREPGINLRGLMTHEGAVYQAGDDLDLIGRSKASAALMTVAADAVRASGVAIDVVSMGCSASVRAVIGIPGITQLRPGRYAFNDLGLIALGLATPESCAVRVVATVVSHPAPNRACIDAGSKSLSQDRLPSRLADLYPGFGLLIDHPGWEIHQLSEELGWLRWVGESEATPLHIGERVQVIPIHICTAFYSRGESVFLGHGTRREKWTTLAHTTYGED